jgi:membrane-associated protease RseP (regulator of RpoE activity)
MSSSGGMVVNGGGNLVNGHSYSQHTLTKTPYNINIQQPPKHISSSLGFKLDETEILQKGVYIVKYVESSTPSALAGLKEGDKITKINGKLTQGMPYEQFCNEIVIAQQQQLRNNMIHLMVMRKSAKSTGTSSYSAITNGHHNSHHSALSPSRGGNNNPNNMLNVVPIGAMTNYQHQSTILTASTSSNLNVNEKTSSYVDEGYVPGSATTVTSATSSSTTTAIGSGPGSTSNVSVVKVTPPPNYQSGKII